MFCNQNCWYVVHDDGTTSYPAWSQSRPCAILQGWWWLGFGPTRLVRKFVVLRVRDALPCCHCHPRTSSFLSIFALRRTHLRTSQIITNTGTTATVEGHPHWNSHLQQMSQCHFTNNITDECACQQECDSVERCQKLCRTELCLHRDTKP